MAELEDAVAYAKTSERREKRLLREQMRAMGLGYRDIAAEFARQYNMRPGAAWREAYGWSLQDAADRINAFRGDTGLDPGGLASMTAPHLSEYENWPGHRPQPTGRRPTPYLLAVLAAVYDCAPADLIDLADRHHLRPADLLILDKYSQPAEPPAQVRERKAAPPAFGRPATEQDVHLPGSTHPAPRRNAGAADISGLLSLALEKRDENENPLPHRVFAGLADTSLMGSVLADPGIR